MLRVARVRKDELMRACCLPAAVAAAVALAFSAASPVHGQAPGWQASIAKVSVDPELNRVPGTAFVVAVDGQTAFLVTCAHVVANESSPRVEFFAAAYRTFTATVRGREPADNPRGLALLVVENPPPEVRALPLAEPADPVIGEDVVVAGYPSPKGQFLVPKTTIAGFEGLDLSLSRETPPGFSGGPVIRGDSAIAVVYGYEPGFGIALISETVRTYLRGLKVPLPGVATAAKPAQPSAPERKPGETRPNEKDGLVYVWIPPGTFQMGCSAGDSECDEDEKPAHPVTISKGFWMGQTEVTVGAYKRYAQAAGKQMPPEPAYSGRALNPGWKHETQPIVNVTWDEAAGYCEWTGMRLPTEAQWEYAARAGSVAARYGPLDDIAWYADNSGLQRLDSTRLWKEDQSNYGKRLAGNRNGPKRVGQKLLNAWNLHDMLGNVFEWTADWYGEKYYQAKDSLDPQGPPGGQYRVLRGGSWVNDPRVVRASGRYRDGPVYRSVVIGVRCAGE
jgi:sulfatase modifying factor 1